MTSFTLRKPAGFRLDAAAAFYDSFTPGRSMGAAHVPRDALAGEVAGVSDAARVAAQLTRMLGLDADGSRPYFAFPKRRSCACAPWPAPPSKAASTRAGCGPWACKRPSPT
jgi:hypothetical protein